MCRCRSRASPSPGMLARSGNRETVMAGRLEGRRILVTGAASGIGRKTAELFVREGARVAFVDRDERVVAQAEQSGGVGLACDVCSEAQVNQAVAAAANAMAGLDGVVNAAGIAPAGKFHTITLESWQRVIDINLTGPFLVCRAALPHLQAAGKGTIVNIASASAILPSGATVSYAASKAGVMVMTQALAAEVAPNIRANAICPGACDTAMIAGVKANDPALFERLQAAYALQRFAQPDEIAKAILFMTSDDSSFMTGSAVAVDGGRSYH
jgi:NAD(P)-dependent dehydrogenase (short-subunit alcohol dehydrogenase family)